MLRTVREAWRSACARLSALQSDAPEVEARELLRAALGIDPRAFLLLDFASSLDPAADERLESLLARRAAREPLQYLLGTVPFCELELEVGPGVLIPRPETEVLVERLSARIEPKLDSWAGIHAPLLVDVGTGSGAILLALLHRFPALHGLGLDRSREALRWARRNRERTLPRERSVGFVRADLLGSVVGSGTHRSTWDRPANGPDAGPSSAPVGGVPASASVAGVPASPPAGVPAPAPSGSALAIDVIVSNPPYIPSHEIESLAPEVRDHEPRLALDGGPDGLVLVTRIVADAARLLRPGGLLAFELALDQADRVVSLLENYGFGLLERYRDLTGRERGVIAERRGSLSPW
ncbi:MAG: peptide chain release factor N(5)-glutamine methyltransferase [Candidatus Eisenbacteria bacterium]|uniref:Release factor glutamine methyltransferase n=1 Tax=Eiseniibacteriota bacterium TaxID=2212470 RepID=A0A956SDN9_UNCEI|nr:peptide chain release factor N(5)-glutamine methyltransferase [Candidatus Eisenbacteria bacterium]MCB9463750.1 peptide chain release factor N(5)-glutamine methyltransferase [Candidatus Eisenbacteria bacterium]